MQPAPEWGPALPEYRKQYISTLSGSRKAMILPDIISGLEEDGMIMTSLTDDDTVLTDV
jgi:hypothetical protein